MECPRCRSLKEEYDSHWALYFEAMNTALEVRGTAEFRGYPSLRRVADKAREESEIAREKLEYHQLLDCEEHQTLALIDNPPADPE